jgi:AraC family transcriptional activator of pobA
MKKQNNDQSPGLTSYDGLYGERNSRADADYVFCERLETRSPSFGWEIKPHLHPGFLQVFFIDQGEFDFYEADKKTHLSAPCLLFIPSTALHGFSFNAEVDGVILTMRESYYDSLIKKVNMVATGGDRVIIIEAFNEPYSFSYVRSMIQTIDRELSLNESWKALMLHSCLQQLFIVVHRLAKENVAKAGKVNSLAIRYYRGYQRLIRESPGTATVIQLAGKLSISPVHLNRICKYMSGKSAGQLLQEYVIREAKKYLTYTSYSIAEIAYTLQFSYPNYFARFFKKHTGLGPKDFRTLKKRELD